MTSIALIFSWSWHKQLLEIEVYFIAGTLDCVSTYFCVGGCWCNLSV